jgi:hypothetical protein
MYLGWTTVKREDLYAEVWAEPMSLVAKRYGLSDVGLAKICRRHFIPVPGRGYWRTLETGGTIKPTPLRAPPKGVGDTLTIRKTTRALPLPMEAEAERKPENQIVVSEELNLREAHQLVRLTHAAMRIAKPDPQGYLSSGAGLLPLKVSKAGLDRGLRIFDALLKALEARGLAVESESGDRAGVKVVVGKERIGFSIEERTKSIPYQPSAKELAEKKRNPWVRIPTSATVLSGELALRLHEWNAPRQTWGDGRTQRVERCLNDFVATVRIIAEKLKGDRIKREREEEIRLTRAQRRHEREDFVAAERMRIKEIDALLTAIDKSRRIREFVEKAEQLIEAGMSLPGIPEEGSGKWCSWARSYADRIDPLTSVAPPLPIKGFIDFEDWFARVRELITAEAARWDYVYKSAYEDMKTPTEAAEEA